LVIQLALAIETIDGNLLLHLVAGVVEVDPQGGVLEVLIEGRCGVRSRCGQRRKHDSK